MRWRFRLIARLWRKKLLREKRSDWQKPWGLAGIDLMTPALPRRLLTNGISIFGGEAIARLATALMALAVARLYGLEAMGNYGYALAVASVLLIVPDFGLHLFVVRELSSSPQRIAEIFWNVHWIKLGLAASVLVFATAFGEWGIASWDRRWLFYILVIRILLQSFSQATMSIFRAVERMQYIAVQQSINSVLTILWVAAVVAFKASPLVLVTGLVVGQLAETFFGWVILRRFLPASHFRMPDRHTAFQIAAASFPFGLTAILLALNLRIDILVLSHYASARILGQFNAGVWFVIAMFLCASLLMSVLFPKLSRLMAENTATGSDYVRGLLKNALMFGALGSLLLWLSAPRVIRLFFGPDFDPAAHILRVLAPTLPLVFLNTIFFFVFAAARRRFVCLGTLAFGVTAGFLVNVYLTSRYGATGSATADVFREFAICGIYVCFLIQGNHARFAGLALLKVFAGATVGLGLGVLFASLLHIHVMWFAAWMFFVLLGTVVTLGLPSMKEWHLLMDDRL